MEKKGAERTEETVVEEGATKYGPLRQLGADVPALLKRKAHAAVEYAKLRSRQGISMFGEPRIDSVVVVAAAEEGADGGGGGSMRWACLKSKARAAGEYARLRTRQGISMFGEPKIDSVVVNQGGDRRG